MPQNSFFQFQGSLKHFELLKVLVSLISYLFLFLLLLNLQTDQGRNIVHNFVTDSQVVDETYIEARQQRNGNVDDEPENINLKSKGQLVPLDQNDSLQEKANQEANNKIL